MWCFVVVVGVVVSIIFADLDGWFYVSWRCFGGGSSCRVVGAGIMVMSYTQMVVHAEHPDDDLGFLLLATRSFLVSSCSRFDLEHETREEEEERSKIRESEYC